MQNRQKKSILSLESEQKALHEVSSKRETEIEEGDDSITKIM
jgi:hypothetical protein